MSLEDLPTTVGSVDRLLGGKIKSAGWVAGDASLDRSLSASIRLAMTK